MTDDEFDIPHEWHEARPYLQTKLEDRRTRLDRRDDVLEGKINSLEQEIHGLGSGVTKLNESFRNVVEHNGVLMNRLNTDYIAQHERWVKYTKDQKEISDELKRMNAEREDPHRFAWRVGLMLSLWFLLLVQVVQKATS